MSDQTSGQGHELGMGSTKTSREFTDRTLSSSGSGGGSWKSTTVPSGGSAMPGPKRIIVCCDGTWQNGLAVKPSKYSNIVKLSRMIKKCDTRVSPPMPQIVYYQSGIGTESGKWSDLFDGATGASLGMKVQEAYAFITYNYQPGDQIFLFGFSRGAYTARMTAALIGELGVLDMEAMDDFPEIFKAYSIKARYKDEKEGQVAEEFLKKFTDSNAKGRLRADEDGDTFTIECVGVFDTVGALGIPCELTLRPKQRSLFNFPDKKLGDHVRNAFHAMALHETRDDFKVTKFEQSRKAASKGQKLKQVWFSGSHLDVGGGYQASDLSDITLAWMVSQIEGILAVNTDCMKRLPSHNDPWGTHTPYNPIKGIFRLSKHSPRELPLPHAQTSRSDPNSSPPPVDYFIPENVHHSVLEQSLTGELKILIEKHPSLLHQLDQLEEEVKKAWYWENKKKEELKDLPNNGLSGVLQKVRLLVRVTTTSGHEDEHSDMEKAWINIASKGSIKREQKNENENSLGHKRRGSLILPFRSKRWSSNSTTSSTLTNTTA